MQMKEADLTRWGKLLALVLRHKPQELGLTVDAHGWAQVDAVVQAFSKIGPFDKRLLEQIVQTDSKGRYSFNTDKTKIRANQGHSLPVDVELAQVQPPEVLYHGTGEKYVQSINARGLLPQSRLYVHLSQDRATAVNVGKRHGRPVVYRVAAGAMARAGCEFYLSVNGVWLTKRVPAEYLQLEEEPLASDVI